jgi:hypothetical protein
MTIWRERTSQARSSPQARLFGVGARRAIVTDMAKDELPLISSVPPPGQAYDHYMALAARHRERASQVVGTAQAQEGLFLSLADGYQALAESFNCGRVRPRPVSPPYRTP